jgi:hypothetical protein
MTVTSSLPTDPGVSAIAARWGGGLGQAASAGILQRCAVGTPGRVSALKLLVVVIEVPRATPAPWRLVWSARARRIDGHSLLACVRMLNASMIWEKPWNNAKNHTQHKIR